MIGDILRERARQHPDRRYVVSGDADATFALMDDRSDRIAAGLATRGVGKGDRVAFVSANRIELIECFFGCTKIGAIQVPLNVFLKGEFLRYQLDDAAPSLIVADAEGMAAADAVRGDVPVIGVDDPALRSDDPPPRVDVGRADLLSIIYTSGTTGMPKGCMLPHGYYVNAATGAKDMYEYVDGDVLYTALPLFHGWARGILMNALIHGLTAVIDPAFSATTVLDRIRDTGATVFAGVGAMGMAILAQPVKDNDAENPLRAAMMFPLTVTDQERFETRFGARVLGQLYGQTETGAITCSRLADARRPTTAGRPVPWYEVAIVDDGDAPVPIGEAGEVVVRPKVPFCSYQGYWHKPAETVRAWRNLWHHTGDLARFDDEGCLTFVDRTKDALRRRGENISSVQLEAAIAAHPKVAEAAVHAVPSEMTEDDIKVCVVLAPDERTTPDELFAFFRDALPYFAVPRYVEVVDALPRNATMRVMKHILRERGVTPATWDLEALGLTVAKADRRG